MCVFELPIFWKYESQSVRTEWHVTNSADNPLILSEEKDKAWQMFPGTPKSVGTPGAELEPRSPALQADSLPSEPSEKPTYCQVLHTNCPWSKIMF